MPSRRLPFLLALALLLPALPAPAESWPERPVRIIVPYAPGGTSDILSRAVGRSMAAATGQNFVIENRSGASGNIGAEIAARAAPDGYTFMVGGPNNFSSNQFLFRNMTYSIERDLVGIALLAELPNVLAVGADVPVSDLDGFVAYSRSHPGTMNCGSPGNATTGHLTLELLKLRTGADVQHVPFRGSALAATELLAGRIQCVLDNLPAHIERIRAGQVRALAVTSPQRSPALPDVPTVAESGLDGFTATAWFAFAGPSAMAPALLEAMNARINAAVADPEVTARITGLGAVPLQATVAEVNRRFAAEAVMWREVIERARVTLD